MSEIQLKPEEKAREKIDKLLSMSGWDVINRNQFSDIYNGCAVCEGLLEGNLEADYLLFVGGKVIGVLEAKRKEKKTVYRSSRTSSKIYTFCSRLVSCLDKSATIRISFKR